MRQQILIFLFGVAAALQSVSTANAATRYSAASGNWSSTNGWSATEGGAAGVSVPVAGDNVVIRGGNTVTNDVASAACASLQLGSTAGGAGGNGSLAFNAGSILACSGNVVLGSTAGSLPDRAGSLNFAAGGQLRIGGAVTVTVLGTFSPGTGTLEYNGAGAQTVVSSLGNYNNLVIGGSNTKSLTANVSVNGDLSVSSAALDLNTFTANRAAAGGSFSLANGASLLIGGAANFPSNFATVSLGATSTVSYDLTGGQTVSPQSYGNLTLAGSGVKTLAGVSNVSGNLTLSGTVNAALAANLTIGGNFSIGAGTIFTAAGNDLTVGGTTLVIGTLAHATSTAGTKIYNGRVTVNAGGVWNNSANEAITFRGGLTQSGTNFTAGTGIYSFETSNQGIAGTVSIPNVTVTGINLTNTGALTVTTTLLGSGAMINAGSLNLNMTGSFGISNLIATAVGNTVNYGGGAQAIRPVGYQNLSLSGSGNKDFGSGSVLIAGNFSNSAGTMVPGTSTITFTGAGKSVSGGSAKNFYNLVINSGASVAHTNGGAITISSDFTNNGAFSQGVTNSLTFDNVNVVHTLAGTGGTTFGILTVNGATTLNAGTHNFTVGGSPFTVASASGVFNGGTATVSFTGVTSLSGGGGFNFNNVSIFPAKGNLTASNTTINVSGNWTNNAAFTLGTSTVSFNGAGTQNIAGSSATVFNNLSVNKSAGIVRMLTNVKVSGSLSLTSGELAIGATTLTLNGAIATASGILSGGASANITFGGTAATTLPPVTLNNLTVNRSGGIAVANGVAVNGQLILTNGAVTGGANLTLGNGATISRSAGSLVGVPAFGTSVNLIYAANLTTGNEVPASPLVVSNLSVSGGTTTLGGPMTVNGSVNITGIGLNTSGNNFPLTVLGNLAVGPSTLTANGSIISIGGNFTGTGTFTPGTSTVVFNGTGTQSIPISSGFGNFYNLTINKSNGAAALTGAVIVNNNLTITAGTLDVTAGNFALSVGGNWGNLGSFIPRAGTVTFNGVAAQAISGATATAFNHLLIANAAGVAVNSTISVAENCTVNSLALLRGTGTVNGPVIVNGILAPGLNVGALTTGAETWNGGASYNWEISNASGLPGVGYDRLNAGTNAITIGATTVNKFTLKLVSLSGSAPGASANFNPNRSYTWTIASGVAVNGYAVDKFAIDTSGFQNPTGGGVFSIEQSGGNVQLKFSGVAQTNAIVTENGLAGNPASEWDVAGAGDLSIQGFSTDISVNKGETVRFKIKTDATNYTIKIYRLGYYNGDGARLVTNVLPTVTLPQVQPDSITNTATGLLDCGNWAESASWSVPTNAVSGVYIARPERSDTLGASHIVFVVRDDASTGVLFQTADTTWQAYNNYGGASLYTGGGPAEGIAAGRAFKVSYNRPNIARSAIQYYSLWTGEYPMLRWLERNGYDVSYTTGVDTDRRGSLLLQHQAFLSVGHDEYWSETQRANVEAARDAGVHLAFFSGDAVYWKTRWETSIDGFGTSNRTLVCYKETHANAKIDPSPEWTGTWRDPRFSPPADGGRPENALMGTLFIVNGISLNRLEVPAAYGVHRFWRNTTVGSLGAVFGDGTLGFEWDECSDNGFQPSGQMKLSLTTTNGVPVLQDYGSTYATGTATHSLSLYRHNGGALVFGAGTVHWSWGLDNGHANGTAVADSRMQQATVNLFADMGIQPGTLQAGLVAAAPSTDSTAPTSVIGNLLAGASLLPGALVTISGTAVDAGGGLVWGAEVSTDGGNTWHPAVGRGNWSYNWTPTTSGAFTIRSRAVDDSGNLETPSTGVSVTVPAQIKLWPDTTLPGVVDVGPDSPVALGVKFRSDTNGYVTGVRFYKANANTGTHLGNLWTSGGVNLGTATFTGESVSGWQQVNFVPPVAIAANTEYVASYHCPNGHYSAAPGYFSAQGVDSSPLHALADGVSGGNGVFAYGPSNTFPNQTFIGGNYWVDLVFAENVGPDTNGPTVVGVSPANGSSGVSIGATVFVNFSEAMDGTSFTNGTITLSTSSSGLVASTVAYYGVTNTAVLTPNSPLTPATPFTVVVANGAAGVKDLAGNALTNAFASSFTTQAPDLTLPTVNVVSPSNGAAGVSLSTAVKVTFSEAMNAATINGSTFSLTNSVVSLVSSTVVYHSSTNTAILTPLGPLTLATNYTVVVSPAVKDLAGNPLANPFISAFTTSDQPTISVWSDFVIPPTPDAGDTSATELGVKFRSAIRGYVTGIRFYKSPANTGTHVGNLWAGAGGAALATGTFTEETLSGWQQVNFTTPVAINSNTTYIASYFTPVGHYAGTGGYFNAGGVTNSPLRMLANNGEDGPNGVYAYGASSLFPNQTFNGANYWVDVVFAESVGPDTNGPTVISVKPAEGMVGASVTSPVRVTFSEAIDPSTFSNGNFTLSTSLGGAVASTVAYYTSTNTAVLTPNSPLALATTYVVAVSNGVAGVKDVAGNPLTNLFTSSFITSDQITFSFWDDFTLPSTVDGSDPAAVELGLKFQSAESGYIAGIRFYKSAANTGIHVGNLWTAFGTNLASATFNEESASGWQQVNFATPVEIDSDTTYIVSYHAPQGRYSFTANFFQSGVTNYPLRALANGVEGANAVFVYANQSQFPNGNGNAANYWVDVVLVTNTLPIKISSITLVDDLATLTWTAIAGKKYRLQYKTTITDASWADIAPDVIATGPTAYGTDSIDTASQRFYRVLYLGD